MKRNKFMLAVIFVLFMGLVYTAGCIFDPTPDVEPPPIPSIDWDDLTDKQHCINNLVLSYKHRQIEPYKELLHPSYEWYLQDRDAEEFNQELMDYAEDVGATDNIFNQAIVLELTIVEGSWEATDTVGTEYWPGSWFTTREYYIQAKFPGSDILYSGHDLVEFVVVPVDDSGTTKYKLRIARDIDFY